MILADARSHIADYVAALFYVYTAMIFAYIVFNLIFSFGMRPGYNRWLNAVLDFLRDVCEPFLRIFRRVIPPIGMFDFSPMIAIIVLYFVRTIVVNAIAG